VPTRRQLLRAGAGLAVGAAGLEAALERALAVAPQRGATLADVEHA
jgi:hypothetical protein